MPMLRKSLKFILFLMASSPTPTIAKVTLSLANFLLSLANVFFGFDLVVVVSVLVGVSSDTVVFLDGEAEV